jgi:single-strand DNA-binding protein
VTELRLPEINRVLLSGRLTHDPERRYAADGTHITNFPIAFNRRYRDRRGNLAEQTGFVTVMTYQRLAEVCGQRLRKGNAVLVEGRLQMREWSGPRGEKRQRLEIRGELVHFLEKLPAAPAGSGERAKEAEDNPLL